MAAPHQGDREICAQGGNHDPGASVICAPALLQITIGQLPPGLTAGKAHPEDISKRSEELRVLGPLVEQTKSCYSYDPHV